MRHNVSREYGPRDDYKPGQRVEFLEEDILFEGKIEKGRWISGKVTKVYDYDPETPEYPGLMEVMCDPVKNPEPWDERQFEIIEFPFHNVRLLPAKMVRGPANVTPSDMMPRGRFIGAKKEQGPANVTPSEMMPRGRFIGAKKAQGPAGRAPSNMMRSFPMDNRFSTERNLYFV